jgi:hypothetical protein
MTPIVSGTVSKRVSTLGLTTKPRRREGIELLGCLSFTFAFFVSWWLRNEAGVYVPAWRQSGRSWSKPARQEVPLHVRKSNRRTSVIVAASHGTRRMRC